MATVNNLCADTVSASFYTSFCAALREVVDQHRSRQEPLSIVVALGGGADSQAVLDLTLRYRQEHPQHRYSAIHLDHAFHPKSPQWSEFLRQQCIEHGIEHIVVPIEVPVAGRQSKEAQGRKMRYQGLAELTDSHAVILLGHHLSDQSETFLLQLKRGSGPKGLAAMARLAPFTEQRLLCRPLLAHSKEEIYLYARTRKLAWIEDDTNVETIYERNFLRHDVLPILIQRWPKFEQTLARSASLCAEQQSLLEELLATELQRLMRVEADNADNGGSTENRDNAIAIEGLLSRSEPYQRALIRLFIERQGATLPSQAQLQQVIRQLHSNRVLVRFGEQQLASFAGYLYLLPVLAVVDDYQWQAPAQTVATQSVALPDAIGELQFSAMPQLEAEGIAVRAQAQIRVGFCQPGDEFQRRTEGKTYTVRQLLKKQRVAPWWRARWPAVWVDGQLAWVAGLGKNAAYISAAVEHASRQVVVYPTWRRGDKAPTATEMQAVTG